MGPKEKEKASLTDELIKALSDDGVVKAIGAIFENRLKDILQVVDQLTLENKRQNTIIAKLETEIRLANSKIDCLEQYNRHDNLIITGLPLSSYAEATSVDSALSNTPRETSQATEAAVIDLCATHLHVDIQPSDISVAHRLKKPTGPNPGPPAVIVRFTSRKARERVYIARRNLKDCPTKIYINEDLTKQTAELFRHARQLVKQKVLHSSWTAGGTVYTRQSPVPGTPGFVPAKIGSMADLPRLPQPV